MAVYDPEDSEEENKAFSPEEIAQREEEIGDSYNRPGGSWRYRRDSSGDKHRDLREASQSADDKEAAAVNERLQDTYSGFKKGDESSSDDGGNDGGFFNPDKDDKKGLKSRLGRLKSRRNLMIGGGVGVGLITALFGLFNFLSIFRLDHIISSLDQKTFARFNASFEGRSDAWFRSYLKLRLTEAGGDYNAPGGENLYFRSNKVDTDNPVRDWYRTLRASSFEKDLWERQGIRFTSIIDSSGNIRLGKITARGSPDINFDVQSRVAQANVDIDLLAAGNLNELNKLGGDIDRFVDTEFFGNSRDARRAVRQALKDNTKSREIFRRRHLRKDIYNMTGIREWRLFEKSRDKVDNAKIGIQRKIISKVFAGDSNSMRFINCLLGGGRCPNTSDPNDPENRVGRTPTGELQPEGQRGEGVQVDDQGNPLKNDKDEFLSGLDTDSITRETSEAVADAVTDVNADLTPTKQMTKNIVDRVARLVGRGPNLWEWAKRLTAIHNLFSGGSNSQAVKLVKNARVTQLIGFYTAMGIARDQIRSGELVSDELNGFYDMTRGFGNSEAWEALSKSYDNGKVSAQGTLTSSIKEKYCRSDATRSFDEYAWYCDSFKPNGGSNAESISKTYSSTIGWLIAPIANAVNSVNSLPIIGDVINAFGSALGNIASIFGEAGLAALRALGLGDNVDSVVGTAVSGLVNFSGAGLFIDPGQPGFAAWIMGGSTGTAELTTRASGGVASTQTTYLYSKQLAASYEAERLGSLSWSERYLSLYNSDSLLASFAFAASETTTGSNMVTKLFAGIAHAPSAMFSSITRPAQAADDTDLAELAGVDKYDIPQACMELDPLDPDYVRKATNANIPNLSHAILNNSDTFWQAVYSSRDQQPVAPEQIYDCALIDQRVRGSTGYAYGYNKDGGYEDGSTTSAPTQPSTSGELIVGDPFTSSVDVACAANTTDLGVHTAYNDGSPVEMRLCAIPNIPSNSAESSSGSQHYVAGADGKVIVNSRVSGAVYAMGQAALADSVQLKASSSFRTHSHQTTLWNQNPNPTYVARPGQSNHQTGVAIDFEAGGAKGGASCSQRARAPSNQVWNWLFTNAERFGYKQYSAESWHWDPSSAASRCNSSQ